MVLHMKAIQVMIDERLLARVDAEPEVRKGGRSAYLRRVLEEHLRRKRAREIAAAYRREYGAKPVSAEENLGPWEDPPWPDE
jgi:metal-responsive CopG/Arc/MetJ family transcriptional regulator